MTFEEWLRDWGPIEGLHVPSARRGWNAQHGEAGFAIPYDPQEARLRAAMVAPHMALHPRIRATLRAYANLLEDEEQRKRFAARENGSGE